MGAPHLSEHTRQSVIRLRRDGYTPKAISEILPVKPSNVCKIWKRYQLSLIPPVAMQPHLEIMPEPEQPKEDVIDFQAKYIALLLEHNEMLKDYIKKLKG